MAIKFGLLMAALLAVTSQLVTASPTPASLAERGTTKDCPSRTFSLTAQSQVGSLLGTTTYQVVVTPENGGKQFVEISSCYLARWGKGCKWLTKGTAKIERPGGAWWKVHHTGYNAAIKNADDITMDGDGCDGQVQHCSSGVIQQCYPDPEGRSVTCILDNLVDCKQGTPPPVKDDPKTKIMLKSKNDLGATEQSLLNPPS